MFMTNEQFRQEFARIHPAERRKAFVNGYGESGADAAMAHSSLLMLNPDYKRQVYQDAARMVLALGDEPA